MPLPPDTAAALDRLGRFGVRLGLERIRALLRALGDPQAGLPTVLVAGTNGKGTVAALLSSMMTAARYRVGLYTSPHLETVEERFRLNGEAIEPDRLAGLIERVLAVADEHLEEPPTYFEVLTACALLWLAEEQVDLAVLEVGLGGRFDATNAVDPTLSVITPIALDHREHLGSTVEEVAREKAGVLRGEVPALVADSDEGVGRVLEEEAGRVGARLVPVGERLRVDAIQRFRPFVDPPERRQRVWLRPPAAEDVPGVETESEVYEIRLSGRHQAENLALAVAVAAELRALGWERLKLRAVQKGARECRWPGRLEEVTLPERGGEGARVLLDVAHNPGGAASLAEFLESFAEPVDLVFGVLADKEPRPMLERLVPRARSVILTVPSGERSMELEALRAAWPAEAAAEAGVEVTEETVPAKALRRALGAALDGSDPRTLVVCGSIVLVGELRAELHRLYGVPEPAVEVKVGP